MSSQFEQGDLDEQWLLDKCSATRKVLPNDTVDAFVDRVWELISIHRMVVGEARSKALAEIVK